MTEHTFTPTIRTVDSIAPNRETDLFKYEPMLFGADLGYAVDKGGDLTREIISKLLANRDFQYHQNNSYNAGLNIVIDTRVTMTMKGSYPSIPGWHCDDVPRGDKYEQPDLNAINSNVQHFMCLVADTDFQSCTEFVAEKFTADIDPEEVWGSLSRAVNKQSPKTSFVKQGEIIRFDQQAIHRASATTNPGWRFFFRLSFTHKEPVNEIRQQVQVYAPVDAGW